MQKPLPKFEDVQRVRLNLPGGYVLSLIQGPGVYSDEGRVEALIFDKDGDAIMDPEGWVNADRLVRMITAMQRRAKKEAANV